jgi:low affinity Fe/Cu permease
MFTVFRFWRGDRDDSTGGYMEHKENVFERFSHKAIVFGGSSLAFIIALTLIVIWLITGPLFDFSESWQLVVNTGTTIITFLMVFLIQRMQNKDSRALHLKLNELVAALHGPSNRLMDVENLSEADLRILADHYRKLAESAKKEKELSVSHSIEETTEIGEKGRSLKKERKAS